VLYVSLLGEQAITDDRDGNVRARSSRAVVLVAFLVVHAGTPQARQRIAGLFWPESTDAQALTNRSSEGHEHMRPCSAAFALVTAMREFRNAGLA
jgi:two-component SAPR family response regulator